jgi:hypothetical protein
MAHPGHDQSDKRRQARGQAGHCRRN